MERTFWEKSVISSILACFVLGCCVPLAIGISGTFISHGGLDFSHYSALFSEHRRAGLFLNTLIMALTVTSIALCVGLSYAFVVTFTDIPCREFFLAAAVFPLLVPPYINAIAWLDLASFIRLLSETLHLPQTLLNPCSTVGVIFIMVCSYFPLVTLTAWYGMKTLDSHLIDQSRLNHSDLQTIKSIILPLITPHIFTGAILVFIYSISNYGVPSILMVPVFSVEIISQISTFYDHGEALVFSAPIVVISLLVILLQGFVEGRRRYEVVSGHRGKGALFQTGPLMLPMLLILSVIVLCSSVVPVLFLFIRALPFSSYMTAIRTSWPDMIQSLINSLIIATITTFIGSILAYHTQRTGRRLQKFIHIAAFIPFALPPSLIALEMLRLVSSSATMSLLRDSLLFAIYFFCFRFIIFPIKIVSASVAQIEPELEEASLFSPAPLWKRYRRIILELNKNGIITAWLLVYILTMGDLEMNLLILPPGIGSLPVRIFNLQHLGRMEVVAALCILNIILIALPSLFFIQSWNRRIETHD